MLAAGLGTRMKSATPKVLHELCGRPMLAYVLDAWESTLDGAAAGHPVVVYSPSVEAILTAVADRATFALQDTPRGTGDAVGAALASVPADAAEILVLSGDVPLVTGADLDAVLEARRQDDAAIALASVFAADPARLGRIVRSEFGTVERIVEANDATPDELDGNEVNAGIYAFDAEWLRRRIGALVPSPATGELYLTDLVALAREDGRIVSAVAFEDDGRFDGINDRSQLAAAEWSLRVRLNEAHMRNGVTMRDPSTVYLDWTVDLGRRRDHRAERHPARRDVASGQAASSARAASSSMRPSASARASGRASSSHPRSRTRRPSVRSATSGRAASSAAVPRSATSPSSRAPVSGRARSSTT